MFFLRDGSTFGAKTPPMLFKSYCASCIGIDAVTVTIEVDMSTGVGIRMVGLPDNAVRESLLRVITALSGYGYRIPGKRILINLAPADIRKEGSSFDLAIAIGLLAVSEQIYVPRCGEFLLLGDTEQYRQYRGLQQVNLYDRLPIKTEAYETTAHPQVRAYEFNCLTGRYNSIDVGNVGGFNRRLPGYRVVRESITYSKLAPDVISRIRTMNAPSGDSTGSAGGGTPGGGTYIDVEPNTVSQDGIVKFEELRTVLATDEFGEKYPLVVSRQTEMRLIDKHTGLALTTQLVPYGSRLFVKDGEFCTVKVNAEIKGFDPFNAVIIAENDGIVKFDDVIENVTYKVQTDEKTGIQENIIIEAKAHNHTPSAHIVDKKTGEELRMINLPVGAYLAVNDGDKVKVGQILIKIPRASASVGDITGGLPRVTELFEARNPSNPAIVSEIDGEVIFGKIKRGNRELSIVSRSGEEKKYLIPLSKQILVQEGDFVRAGTPLSDGAVTPSDILAIKGPTAVQDYIVNEVQDVYRLQNVKINDKHFEIIVRQMMRKVEIIEPGDTRFLEKQLVDKNEFMDENDRIWGRKYITDPGDSQIFHAGQIVTARKLRDENSSLKRRDLRPAQARDTVPATSAQVLQGITRAALQTSSFMSAASFQETTKVLNDAAINGKVDYLEGMKENVICGHLIPAGTGLREFQKLIVYGQEEYQRKIAEEQFETYGEQPVAEAE